MKYFLRAVLLLLLVSPSFVQAQNEQGPVGIPGANNRSRI